MKLAPTLLAVVLLSATGANATLVSALGGQVVNDTDLNITWLADANYAKTSGYDADGLMTWSQAQGWIASLNAANHLGYSDWRLPTTLQPDASCVYGYNCTGSEMGHLFYNELGGSAGNSILTSHNANLALFQNVQAYSYWSGTDYATSADYAWYFTTTGGYQDIAYKGYNNYMYPFNVFALAVRPGQVAAVPVPAAAWLLGSGLLGLIGVARRKAA